MDTTDDEDWRLEGQVAHLVGAQTISHNFEAWELLGAKISDVEITPEMVAAIDVYTNFARRYADTKRWRLRIECPIELRGVDHGFGTVDLGAYDTETRTIEVNDYKHGVGVYVDVENNPQLKYYAAGFLDEFPEAENVILRIIQPRITWAAPIRECRISALELKMWRDQILVPAMAATETDMKLWPGEHCRFCPAKLVCPALAGLFAAAAKADEKSVLTMDDATLGRDYQMRQAVKSYLTAQEKEVYRRLMGGSVVPGTKLVAKKADRVFKDGAEVVLKATLGDDAYTKPELKSPAQIEKLPAGAELVKTWAFTPQTGFTVALDTDGRQGVKMKSAKQAFAHVQPADGE